jgi:hypothetical protein
MVKSDIDPPDHDFIPTEEIDDYLAWQDIGIQKGWVSAPVCYQHDGPPLRGAEAEAWDEGDDRCVFILRVW